MKPAELLTSFSINAIASASIGTPDVAHPLGGGTSGDASSYEPPHQVEDVEHAPGRGGRRDEPRVCPAEAAILLREVHRFLAPPLQA